MKFTLNINLRSAVVGALAFVTMLFFLGGYGYYLHQKVIVKAEKYQELSAIASLKTEQFLMWHNERLQEVKFFTKYNPLSTLVSSILSDNPEVGPDLRETLLLLMINKQYENIFILDKNDQIVFSVIPLAAPDSSTIRFSREAYRTNSIHLTDFYYCPLDQKIQIEIIAPLSVSGKGILGTMVFQIDPSQVLFPLIQDWPIPSQTAETLFVRQVGDSVWYLNDLRNVPNPNLKLKISLDRTEIPAVQAVQGQKGILEGIDYSGMKVLANFRQIPDTHWYLGVKAGTDEIYKELNNRSILILIISTLMIILFGALVGLFYYSRQRNLYRELHEKSDELVKSQEEFETTLYSIGDGVITTDIYGRVKHMNPVAEKYTGWTEIEAAGKEIQEVFNIVNEETHLVVENPVVRVLREGAIVGLANHTLLISRSGMETPINDSGAPIKDQEGHILGTVVVFSDQTAKYLRNRIMETRILLFEYSIDHSLQETVTRALDEIGIITASPIGFFHFVSDDQMTLKQEIWSTHTQEICESIWLEKYHKLSNAGIWADCIRQRKAVVHNDYERIFDGKGLPEGHIKLIREVVVPIFRNGKIVAVIGVGNKPVLYSESDVETISSIADVCWDIAQHKMKEESLRESEERFAALFERAPLGYQSLDENGRIIEVNLAWLETLGYQKEEVIGHWFGEFVPGANIDTFMEKFELFKKMGKVHTEYEMMTKKGELKYVAFDGRVGYNSDGSFEKTHCILNDITDRKKMVAELVLAKEKAEESDRLKSAFLANVSHEIRTPMNGIMGFLDLLNEPELSESQRDLYLEVIQTSGKRLLDTINDIVEISKIESGSIELHSKPVDVKKMMDYMLTFFQNQAVDKNLMISLEEHLKDEDAIIMVDKSKLGGIMTNLLNNAIKFTKEGGVSFGNYLKGNDVVFWVRDTGVGIPAERYESIFDRFYQIDNSLSRMHEGCGLGLPIVKAYLQKMEGKIWLESEVERGSTFYFSVPYIPVKKKSLERVHPIEPETKKRMLKVLVAEDDLIGYQYLQTVLIDRVKQLCHSINGEETVRMVKEDPDISMVLMDIKMPGMDGLEATREIRKFNRDIPIIAQTAYAFSGDKEKAIEAGCNDYITKPINKFDLLRVINKYFTD